MESIDIPRCLAILAPGNDYAFFGETSDYNALDWRGADPKPTLAEIEACWAELQQNQSLTLIRTGNTIVASGVPGTTFAWQLDAASGIGVLVNGEAAINFVLPRGRHYCRIEAQAAPFPDGELVFET